MVLPTLGTNPKRSQSGSTKQEAKDVAVLQEPWRTVRGPGADGPRSPCGGPRPTADCLLNTNRMTQPAPRHADGPYHVLGLSASNSWRADSPRRPGGRSAKHPPVKSNWATRSKPKRSRTRDEHVEHLDELLHADSPRAPCGRSARHENSSRNLKPKPPKLLLVHGSRKRLKLLRKDLGKMWSVPRGCYAPELGSSNNLNHRESNHHWNQPKT
jgi:hypothetical protein